MSGRYHSVNPFLYVDGASALVGFLETVFGACERERIVRADGSIGHAEVEIGDSTLMISDANGEFPACRSAAYVYVTDVDATYRRALDAKAETIRPPADQFYGNREAGVRDPFGNLWWIAQVNEELEADEIARRGAEVVGSDAEPLPPEPGSFA